MRIAIAIVVLLLFAGCATQTVEVPKEVKVQVSVPCVKEKLKRPELRTESDLMAMDRNRRTLATWSDLRKHEIYTAELEAQAEACSRLPAP